MIQNALPEFRMPRTLSSFVHALILCILLSSTLIAGLSLISEPVLGVHEVAGAIWTTDSTGEQVNGNLYSNPRDVHLIGGPQKPGGFGLAYGWYYFQVTDPSGYLLSTDDDEDRMFRVDDGCIVETTECSSGRSTTRLKMAVSTRSG